MIQEGGYDAWVFEPYNGKLVVFVPEPTGRGSRLWRVRAARGTEVISDDLIQREAPTEPVLTSDFFDFLRTSRRRDWT